jgi:hypothetical protein
MKAKHIAIGSTALLATIAALLLQRPNADKLRAKVIAAALAEPAESPRVQAYWKDTLTPHDFAGGAPKSWCGAFDLWALHQAGLALNVKWDIGLGFVHHLPMTRKPEPGDIAYFEHNQHHALVKSVNPNGTVSLINGNGTFGHITESSPSLESVTAFYSINPWILDALK